MFFYYRENLYEENSTFSFIKKHVRINSKDRDYVNTLDKNNFVKYVETYMNVANDPFYDFKTLEEFRRWFIDDYIKASDVSWILREMISIDKRENSRFTVQDYLDTLCDGDFLESIEDDVSQESIELAYTFLETFEPMQNANTVYKYVYSMQKY